MENPLSRPGLSRRSLFGAYALGATSAAAAALADPGQAAAQAVGVKKADLPDLTDEEMADLMKLARRCQSALRTVMKPDGFNIGLNIGKVAGAGIAEHLHLHVVPRWQGDTNFMPVLSGTVVLPEALTQLAAKLRAALAQS